MEDHWIRKVTVLGGGAAGWMTASERCSAPGHDHHDRGAVHSQDRVGEATVPNLHKTFVEFLGQAEGRTALRHEVRLHEKELAAQLSTNYDYLRRLHGH